MNDTMKDLPLPLDISRFIQKIQKNILKIS